MTITDSEWKIMELLWAQEPMTITQMTKELQGSTGWTKHTIISFLKRMEEKDVVFYEETGKAKQYYTLISRTDAVRELIEELVEKAAKGDVVKAIQMFIDVCYFTEEQLLEVREIVARKKVEEPLKEEFFDIDF